MASGSGQASSSWSKPWKAQQPYLKSTYEKTSRLGDVPLEYYPESTVAPESEATLAGRAGIEQRAGMGSDLLPASQEYARSLLRGDYLEGNPHREEMFRQGADDISRAYMGAVAPGVDTRYEGAGRYGGALRERDMTQAQRNLGQELGDLWTRTSYADYAQERGYMDRAPGMATQLAREDYYDPMQQLTVGAQYDARAQEELDALMARFEFGQNEPWQRLGMESSGYGAPVMTSQAVSRPKTGTLDWITGILGAI